MYSLISPCVSTLTNILLALSTDVEYWSTRLAHVCLLPADPPEKLQLICPTCPLLLPVDSQQAVKAAAISLAFFKRQSTLSAGLGVKRITRAAAQA